MTNQGRHNGKTAEAIAILNAKIAALTAENAELSRKLDISQHNERDLREVSKRLKHDLQAVTRQRDAYREKAISATCSARQGWEGCNAMCSEPEGEYCDACREAVDNG